MKVALLHYWLINMRGGENVLAEFCKLYPDADIFTHAYNPEKIESTISSHRIIETCIGKLPGARKSCQKYLPFMPRALSKLDLSGYDLLLSSESGPIKGVRKPAGAKHICYCHTPMRYLWDMFDDYYRNTGICGKIGMKLMKNYLRKYDLKSAEGVDEFIANSNFVAQRIKRIYNRDSTVIYPPVNVDFFSKLNEPKGDFYLVAGQLNTYKRADLAVAACCKMKRKLVVIGMGEQMPLLKKIAAGNPDILFAGRTSQEDLQRYYAQAKALLFPGVEDFGIVPLEAQAANTPVIAYGVGGALETVVDGKTGLFFKEQTVESLCHAMEEFESMKFNREDLVGNTRRFSQERFRMEISEFVKKTVS